MMAMVFWIATPCTCIFRPRNAHDRWTERRAEQLLERGLLPQTPGGGEAERLGLEAEAVVKAVRGRGRRRAVRVQEVERLGFDTEAVVKAMRGRGEGGRGQGRCRR